MPGSPPPEPFEQLPHQQTRFAHESERQLAQLLDFYGVDWEYEPTTFVLEADDDGNPLAAFTPDFYLPAHDLYVEVTTLNQRLVTRKNRKLRQLRERQPDVRVKLLYQRDYLALLVKYGLEPAATGTGPQDDRPVDAATELGLFGDDRAAS